MRYHNLHKGDEKIEQQSHAQKEEKMAKYEVTFNCGHTETVELIGPGKERERKIKNMERNMMCSQCYKKQKEEEQSMETVVKFSAEPLPSLDEEEDIVFCLWLFGSTKKNKETIKEIGYRWGERPTSVASRELCWYKIVKEQNLDDEKDRIMKTFQDAICVKLPSIHFAYYEIAKQRKEKYQERIRQISQLSKPDCPELLLDRKWNGKIYGKAGRYSVYLNGEKTMISDQEAEEFRLYQEAENDYQEAVMEIKRRYRND